MSYRTGPKIVTDGLVLCLDAADRNSYPGSGTTIYNLAPYTYNGSFISTSANTSWNSNGYWQVNDFGGLAFGVSEISTDPSKFLYNISGELTYEIWHYPTLIQAQKRLMSTDRSDYHCLIWYDGFSGNGVNISSLEWAYDGKFLYSSGWSTNQWYHIVGTGSRANSRMRIYRNGQQVASTSVSARNPLGPGSTRPFAVNKNVEATVDTQYGGTGYTSIVRIYGKELSADEVNNNFEATKGRFGL
jgi:hypothetical protein